MYFPKSQIKTNLYTNGGEFTLKNSQAPYRGYYYKTSEGKYFSGRTLNESPSFELVKITSSPLSTNPTGEISTVNYYFLEREYARSTRLSFSQPAPSPPKQSYPVLTENDYKTGEFQRYFVKKGNEFKFIEISQSDYLKYINQDKEVMYELYTPTQINWVLTGDKEQVYKVNQSIVARVEREQNLPGFTFYFKNKFTQFHK